MGIDLNRRIRGKNHTLNQWEQYFRRDALESFPPFVQFPTGTRCNLVCRFCTERKGEKGKTFPYRDLPFEEFRSLVEKDGWGEGFGRAMAVDLYGWGEPFFNPEYEKIFDYVTQTFPGLGINVSTNGILFDEKWCRKLVAHDYSHVNFSINAATPETYQRLMGSYQFERVIANIRRLTDWRDRCRTKNPHISLSYVATTENIRELPQFVHLSADLKADCIFVQDVIILNEDTARLSLANDPPLASQMFQAARGAARERKLMTGFLSFEIHPDNYVPTSFQPEKSPDPYPYMPTLQVGGKRGEEDQEVPSPVFTATDCFEPWERFMVCADGQVVPCCRFQNVPGASLGNIYEQSFGDIWNGEAYRYLRRTVNTQHPSSVCAVCPRKAGLD